MSVIVQGMRMTIVATAADVSLFIEGQNIGAIWSQVTEPTKEQVSEADSLVELFLADVEGNA
jgi:hypothetical protein